MMLIIAKTTPAIKISDQIIAKMNNTDCVHAAGTNVNNTTAATDKTRTTALTTAFSKISFPVAFFATNESAKGAKNAIARYVSNVE